MNKPEKTLCCSECKSDDIEFQVWANEFDEILTSTGIEEGRCYCNKCVKETTCTEKIPRVS